MVLVDVDGKVIENPDSADIELLFKKVYFQKTSFYEGKIQAARDHISYLQKTINELKKYLKETNGIDIQSPLFWIDKLLEIKKLNYYRRYYFIRSALKIEVICKNRIFIISINFGSGIPPITIYTRNEPHINVNPYFSVTNVRKQLSDGKLVDLINLGYSCLIGYLEGA